MAASVRPRVAVIGAGISGVAAAAHLKREGLDVSVFERAAAAGGIWVLDERKPLEPIYPSIHASEAENHYHGSEADIEMNIELLLHAPPGPCYLGLKNNVGTKLLQTTLNSFPPGTTDFVSHSVLKSYIQETALKTGVHAATHYNTKVRSIQKRGSKWILDALTLTAASPRDFLRRTIVEEFDSIVVASGHYHAARVPDIKGLAEWKLRWPHRVQHSKGYRGPDVFKGTNFMLIGGSVSATDIARELHPRAGIIYQSHRNGAFDLPASLLPDNTIRVEEIVSFDGDSKGSDHQLQDLDPIPATVTLKSGKKLCNIHHVIVCTGYQITLPFLSHLHSDEMLPQDADAEILVTDGMQIHNLHKDIFYIQDPSLAFVGVPYFTATFTLFEFQAMVVAKVLTGQAKLPSQQHMRAEYQRRVVEKGYGKGFHSLKDQEEEYVNELLSWVNEDMVNAGRDALTGHTNSWKAAKADQVVRMKALFGSPASIKQLESSCS